MLLLALELILLGRELDVQVLEALVQVVLRCLNAGNFVVLVFDLLSKVRDFGHLLVNLHVSPVDHVLFVVELATVVFLLGGKLVKADIFQANGFLQLADLLVQLGDGDLHALLHCVSFYLQGLDVVDVPFDLFLHVSDLVAPRYQLVLLSPLLRLKGSIVFVRLMQLVALVLEDGSHGGQLVLQLRAHTLHLALELGHRLPSLLLVEIDLVPVLALQRVHSLRLSVACFLLQVGLAILVLRNKALDLGLQLAELGHQLLLVALVVAHLRRDPGPQVVSLDLAVAQLLSEFVVSVGHHALLLGDLHTQLLDRLLLPPNHVFFLFQLHLIQPVDSAARLLEANDIVVTARRDGPAGHA